jgi:hypothetical protein
VERPIEILAEAIEATLTGLGAVVFDDGMRMIVSAKDGGKQFADIRFNHEYDIDEVVYWLTESDIRNRSGQRVQTFHETIADAIEDATDPEKIDTNIFPRPIYEPRTLRCLPQPIADEIRRRIVYRLLMRGYRGPQLRMELSSVLIDYIPTETLEKDIVEIAKEVSRNLEIEREVEIHFFMQFFRQMTIELWESGDRNAAIRTGKLAVDLLTKSAKREKVEYQHPMQDWSDEELVHYLRTKEMPKEKPTTRVH